MPLNFLLSISFRGSEHDLIQLTEHYNIRNYAGHIWLCCKLCTVCQCKNMLFFFWEPLTCSWKGTFLTVGAPGFANTATAELLAELNRERVHTLLSCTDKPVAGPFLFSDHGIISCSKKGRRTLEFT